MGCIWLVAWKVFVSVNWQRKRPEWGEAEREATHGGVSVRDSCADQGMRTLLKELKRLLRSLMANEIPPAPAAISIQICHACHADSHSTQFGFLRMPFESTKSEGG